MRPSEQIEWIHADAVRAWERSPRPGPISVVYLVAPADIAAMTRDPSKGIAGCQWFELATAAGYVEVRGATNRQPNLAPTRCYRCPCGALFADDSSRSGKCARCMQRDAKLLGPPIFFDHTDAFRGVDRSATPERLSGAKLATPPARPDGFDQGRIDQIKAMLTSKPKP